MSPKSQSLSVLVIGNTYADPHNWGKLREMARWCRVDVATAEASSVSHFGLRLEEPLEDESLTVFRLPMWGTLERGTRYGYHGLGKVLEGGEYDVVLCESEPWSMLRWQSWLLTRVYSPSARFAEFTWENVERLGLKGFLLGLVYRAASWTSDFLIAGNGGAARLCRNHGFADQRIAVLPQLGVDTSLYRRVSPERKAALREEWGIAPGSFLVGFCGRMVASKGVDDLVEAVELVRGEDAGVELALMGAGSLEELIGALADEAWIYQRGPCRHHEVASFIQMLDVFVLPSKTEFINGVAVWEEQFGHVLIEAMACGVPVLGSRSGAIPEVLANEDVLFDVGDVKQLAKAILSVRRNDEGRAKLVESQVRRVEGEFAHPPHAKRWVDLLVKVARKKEFA